MTIVCVMPLRSLPLLVRALSLTCLSARFRALSYADTLRLTVFFTLVSTLPTVGTHALFANARAMSGAIPRSIRARSMTSQSPPAIMSSNLNHHHEDSNSDCTRAAYCAESSLTLLPYSLKSADLAALLFCPAICAWKLSVAIIAI